MQNNMLFSRGKFLFTFLLTIFLAGCKVFGAQSIPPSGGTFPTITLVPTITPISTVTSIANQATDTPNAGIGAIIPTVPNPFLSPGTAQGQSTPVLPGTPAPSSSTDTLPPALTSTTSPAPSLGQLPGKVLGLLPSRQGLWVMYPDGTHATLVTKDPILSLAISPSGWVAAYITNPDPENVGYNKPFGYTLNIITLYNDRITTVTSLDPPGISANSPGDVLDSAYQSINAYNHGALAWSPDSTTLAFTSSHEAAKDKAASSNIYLYHLGNASLQRLTDIQLAQGPGHPYGLSWSPYGRHLYFDVAYSFGTGSGYYLAGAWIFGLDGSAVQVASGDNSNGENLINWMNESNVLLSSTNSDCGSQNLRKVNLTTGQTAILWLNCYQTAQYDRLRDQVLVSVIPNQGGANGENPPGLYIVSVTQPQAKQLSNHGFERILSGSPFGSNSAAWYGYNRGEGLFTIQRTGEVQPLFTGAPFDGSTGADFRPLFRLTNGDWVWTGDGLYLCHPGSQPQQVMNIPPANLSESPGVPGLFFFLGPDQNNQGNTSLYGVRIRDWQPFVVDPNIVDPLGIDWTR